MSALSGAAEARADAEGGLSQQLTSSSEGFQTEISALKEEQQVLESRLKGLLTEREGLQRQLEQLSEEISVLQRALESSSERERQIKANAKRVAGELQRELSIEEIEARKVGDRQRLLLEANETA